MAAGIRRRSILDLLKQRQEWAAPLGARNANFSSQHAAQDSTGRVEAGQAPGANGGGCGCTLALAVRTFQNPCRCRPESICRGTHDTQDLEDLAQIVAAISGGTDCRGA